MFKKHNMIEYSVYKLSGFCCLARPIFSIQISTLLQTNDATVVVPPILSHRFRAVTYFQEKIRYHCLGRYRPQNKSKYNVAGKNRFKQYEKKVQIE